MRQDIYQQLASYRGYLEWDTFSTAYDNGALVGRPKVVIELYIKETGVPIRKPKVTEINTIPVKDPLSGFDTRAQALFWGAPDILQVSLSGWIITPLSGNSWATVDSAGSALGLGNICYPELIDAYIEGRMNKTINEGTQRRDPDRYITPHGSVYNNPIIAAWDWNFTLNRRKQTFSMTLWLEK